MKKSVMYSETRTWFFNLDMAEGALKLFSVEMRKNLEERIIA